MKFKNIIKKNINNLFIKIDKLLDLIFKHSFALNLIYALLISFSVIYLINDWNGDTSTLDESKDNFLRLGLIIGAISFTVQAINLLKFEKKVEKLKKELNKKGFIKFIEYEYKKNDESIFSGLTYALSISIGILALYISSTSIEISAKIASSKNGEILMEGIENFFFILGGWITIIFSIFVLFFAGYKFNQLSKRNFLEKTFYGEYKK
ncbi:MAG: hypothetical protein QM490_01425 [Candidatus Gracilibacteria bacterium]